MALEEYFINAVKLLFVLILALSMPIALLLIKYAFSRRSMPGANCFILMLISAIFYNGAYIGEICSGSLNRALLWYNIEHIFIPVQQYFWVIMGLEYINIKKRYLTAIKYAALYHPVCYIAVFFTNDFHKLYVNNYRFISNGFFDVIVTDKGPLFTAVVVSGTLLAFYCSVMYVYRMMNTPRLHRKSYIIMLAASVAPWFTVYLNATNLNFLGIDYFPVISVFSGILYMRGLFHYRIFNIIPIATETVFRQSNDAIAIVDIMNRIVDLNTAFITMYPEFKKLSGKETLDKLIAAHPETEEVLHKSPVIIRYEHMAENKTVYYSAEITDICREDGNIAGKLLILSDVTLFIENQKQLELLASNAIDMAQTNEMSFLQAQIEPHFLNNTLSVISSMITRKPDEAKILIGNLSEYLISRCYFDTTSEMVPLEKELEIVDTYVSIEKSRFGKRLNFIRSCDINLPEQLQIPRLILQPLVENAIRHGILKKADGGNVWLIIYEDTNSIHFKIEDDGAGIANDKLDSLTEGSATSIGLCNIQKRLLRYYGEGLHITSKLGQGTTVCFSVPVKLNVEAYNYTHNQKG